MTISKSVIVSIQPDPPVINEVGIQADMFLAASLPKQPSTLIAETTFSFTDDDES